MSNIKKVHERISSYIPESMRVTIDTKRSDIPRSRFILRILEKHLNRGI
jgi:hypothetical protein